MNATGGARRRSISVVHLTVLLLASSGTFGFAPFGTDPVREGNRLFAEGKFEEAKAKYGEALVDNPDDPLLNFNMGDAHYKTGSYTDAIASFSRVTTAGDPKREATVAYNIGNSHYQMAATQEAEKPQDALKGYAEALVAYRRAIGADPAAADAKHNYEFALKKLKELQKKLEEQKQQQEQQQDQQQEQQDQQQQEQQDQQQQGEQQQQQEQQGEEQQQQEEEQQQAGEQQQEEQQQAEQQEQGGEQQQPEEQAGEPSDERQGGQAQTAEKSEEESPEKREAAALIDMAADEELQPDEFARRVQGGVVVEPSQDW